VWKNWGSRPGHPSKPGNPGIGSGGGLCAESGSITLRNSTVEFNSASDTGGGLFIAGKANVCLDAFTSVNVINNTAPSHSNIDGSYKLC
jgi:hypothetical protein